MTEVKPAASGESVDQAVGRALVSFRQMAGLTLRELAQESGVSAAMISRIENGQASPSLATLEALSRALDLPLVNFFRHTIDSHDITHVKAGQGLQTRRHGSGLGHAFQLLGYHKRRDIRFEPVLVTLSAEVAANRYPTYHDHGCELIYLLEGEMEYRYGDRLYRLKEGDSLSFDSAEGHGVAEILSSEVKFLVVFAQRI